LMAAPTVEARGNSPGDALVLECGGNNL